MTVATGLGAKATAAAVKDGPESATAGGSTGAGSAASGNAVSGTERGSEARTADPGAGAAVTATKSKGSLSSTASSGAIKVGEERNRLVDSKDDIDLGSKGGSSPVNTVPPPTLVGHVCSQFFSVPLAQSFATTLWVYLGSEAHHCDFAMFITPRIVYWDFVSSELDQCGQAHGSIDWALHHRHGANLQGV